MDLHVCIKIDDDAVNKIAKVITETVKRVTEIQQTGMAQQSGVPVQSAAEQQGVSASAVQQTGTYSAQIAQATQIPVQAMTGQAATAQQAVPVSQNNPAPQQTIVPAQAAVPTAAHAYTLEELANAAMPLMDRGMQAQLQDLLAGYGVESLPMLPAEQYGNFATALRGMGAQI